MTTVAMYAETRSHMMTSSNGNIFRITGPLCGEFTGHRWIPITKASDVELWCFLWSSPEQMFELNNRDTNDLRCHHARYDINVMADYCSAYILDIFHDDIIKWKHFPRYWPFVWGIHWSPVNSPHKGQWHKALRFSLMMMSSNGNIFRITGSLCGEFTGHRWIPLTKASDAKLLCFHWSSIEKTIETPVIETPLCSLWHQCNGRLLFCLHISHILFHDTMWTGMN